MNLARKYIVNIFLIVVAFIFGIYVNVPLIKDLTTTVQSIGLKKTSIQSLNRDMEIVKKNDLADKDANQELKKIYEPEIKTDDKNMVFSLMFDSIMGFAKNAGLKVRTVEFLDAPEGDTIVQNQSSTCVASLLNAEIIGTYSEVQAFLRELYRYKYLVNIQKMEIAPYERDKKILIVKMGITLYAKK